MKISLTLVALFIFTASHKESKFYDSTGKLLADPELSIGEVELENWMEVEDRALELISTTFKYPEVAIENNISGKMILSFQIDSTRIFKEFNSPKYLGWGVENRLQKIIGASELLKELAPLDGTTATYYIALQLSINDSTSNADPGYLKINFQKEIKVYVGY